MCPRLHAVSVLFAITVTSVWAQTPGVPATVEGRVTNSMTGEGIGNATIRLVPMRGVTGPADKTELQTLTAADGSFHLDQIAAGAYIIVPAREGFSLQMKSGVNRYLDLHEGQLANGLIVQMVPDASLTGKVLDNNGNPVPNARVVALLPSMYGNQSSYDERGNANCDKNGLFTLKGLVRGHYYLAASIAPPKQPRSGSGDKTASTPVLPPASEEGPFVPTFYPRALSVADATPISADPEQGSGDLTIYLQRAFTHVVKGKVGETGPGGGNLTVQLTSRDLNVNSGLFAPSVDVAPDRSFVFPSVLPGSYTLRLMNRRTRRLLAREDIDAGSADVTGLVLNPLPPIVIRGTVAFESSGAPSPAPNLTIMARPLDDQVRAGVQTVQSAADGTFLLQRLDPGTYSFFVTFRGGNFYLHSIEFNGQDVTNRAVDLSQVGSGQMEIRVGTGVGEVDGNVEDNGGTAGNGRLWTVLIPEDIAPDASNVRVSLVKTDGTFALPNVPPGNYQILAADQADPRLWQNSRFLAQIRNQGTSLTLEQSGHAQVQLEKIAYPLLQQTAEQLGVFLQ